MWTSEQILSLAPDAQVAKAARRLARPAKWVLLATDSNAVWGEYKGSGKKPYRVAVDLAGPAFKCSCPSRKKPCKHAIGLFLTAQANPHVVTSAEAPDWVAKWLRKRQAAAKRKAKASESPVVDEAAQARRAARREELVQQGIEALRLWMEDLVRQGLSVLPSRPQSFWEKQAARLVDAQAPGLARHIRAMSTVPYSGEGWPARLFARLAKLHLLLEAYARLDTLPLDLQEEVRTQVGWPQDQASLLNKPGIHDRWWVLSVRTVEEERLRVRYTWLWGMETQQPALILDFIALGQQSVTGSLPFGAVLDAELVYFAGPVPQRALLKVQHYAQPMAALSGYATLATAFRNTGEALARNPWLERFLWPLEGIIPVYHQDLWYIQDKNSAVMPLSLPDVEGWRLLALSGGHPVTLVGEWDLEQFVPLSVWTGHNLVALRDDA